MLKDHLQVDDDQQESKGDEYHLRERVCRRRADFFIREIGCRVSDPELGKKILGFRSGL